MILTLLIAQIMMILRNESMKIKRKFRRDIYVKAAGCLGNYAAKNPRTRAVCSIISSLPCFNYYLLHRS